MSVQNQWDYALGVALPRRAGREPVHRRIGASVGALLLIALGLAACGQRAGVSSVTGVQREAQVKKATATRLADPAATATVAAATQAVSTSAPRKTVAGSRCEPTPGEVDPPTIQTPPDAPSRIMLGPSAGVVEPPETATQGQRLVIEGTVYDDTCRPLAGAVLYAVQTNAAGEYGPGHRTGQDLGYYRQGTLRTDARGHYAFVTVRPGHYQGTRTPPPAHIHLNVHHPTAVGIGPELRFRDDPYFRNDPEAVAITLSQRQDVDGAYLYGVFDIVLRRR